MSSRLTKPENGVRRVARGKGDRRYIKGDVGTRTEPKLPHGDVSLWRFSEGQKYTLFLSMDDAYNIADALDALLADHEAEGTDE